MQHGESPTTHTFHARNDDSRVTMTSEILVLPLQNSWSSQGQQSHIPGLTRSESVFTTDYNKDKGSDPEPCVTIGPIAWYSVPHS